MCSHTHTHTHTHTLTHSLTLTHTIHSDALYTRMSPWRGIARVAAGSGALAWLGVHRGMGGLSFGLAHLLLLQADPLVDCALRLGVAVWWMWGWSRCLLVREGESEGGSV
jgi:hypothetical protein